MSHKNYRTKENNSPLHTHTTVIVAKNFRFRKGMTHLWCWRKFCRTLNEKKERRRLIEKMLKKKRTPPHGLEGRREVTHTAGSINSNSEIIQP
jgi:hypothetical protein